MMNFAEFQILDRVGKVKDFQGKTHVTLCANYGYTDRKSGERKEQPHWNEIVVFAETTRAYINKYCKPGDLAMARGRIKQNIREAAGQTIYSVDLITDPDGFSILAQKSAQSEGDTEQEPAAKSKPKAKK